VLVSKPLWTEVEMLFSGPKSVATIRVSEVNKENTQVFTIHLTPDKFAVFFHNHVNNTNEFI
jgi:hypothetical protein